MKKRIFLILLPLLLFASTIVNAQWNTPAPIKWEAALPATCNPTSKTQRFIALTVPPYGLYQCSSSGVYAPVAGTGGSGSSTSLSATYGNSLVTAIASIGATPTTLPVTADTICSTSLVVPATLILKRENKATIIKSAGCTINFQGEGIADPESQTAIFSGFSAGNITWTGTVFPKRLSSLLWADALSSTKLTSAIAAMIGKAATIVAYPGQIAVQVTVKNGLALHLTKGLYTNTIPYWNTVGARGAFNLEDNTRVYGDGMTQTIIEESTNDNAQIFAVSGLQTTNLDGYNENIEISDLQIAPNAGTVVNSAMSAIHLGNTKNGHATRIYVKNTHGFAAYLGAFGTAGFSSESSSLTYFVVEGLQTQNMGYLSGRNGIIAHNIFRVTNLPTSPSQSTIDIEPNAPNDLIENLQITDNIIDARLSQQTNNGITVQTGGAPYAKNVLIADNTIIGADDFHTSFKDSDVNVATNAVNIVAHGLQTTQVIGISNVGGAVPAGLSTAAIYNAIRVDADNLKFATSYANALTGTAVDITAAAGGGTHDLFPFRKLTNGIQIAGCDNCTTQNNVIKGAGQTGISISSSINSAIRNNRMEMVGGGGTAAMYVIGSVDTDIAGNLLKQSVITAVNQSDSIVEYESNTGITTTSGSPTVNRLSGAPGGELAKTWWKKRTVNINGTNYIVQKTAADFSTITLTTNVPVSLSAKTFTDANVTVATDNIAITAHGFETGGAVLATTTGAVPVGLLNTVTLMYAIKIDANNIKLASTFANAVALTPIDITSAAGGGTHTLTPQLVTRFSNNRYVGNRASSITLEPTGTSVIYSKYTDFRSKGSVAIDPANIGATTVSSQTFTLTGAAVGDNLILNPPALTAGLLVQQSYVSSANTVTIVFYNQTAGAIDQVSGSWNYTLLR